MERQTQLATITPEEQKEKHLVLTDRENYAFQQFLKNKDYPIAATTAAKLFELFLAGKTTEEIRQLNKNLTLGQIVHARIENEWDRKYLEYKENLHLKIRERLENVILDTTSAVVELLTAKNKLYRDKVLMFIQTGDEAYIQDIGLGGLDGYKKLVELLQKLTGTEGETKKVKGEIVHKVETTQATGGYSSQQAENIIEAMLTKDASDSK